MKEWIDDLDKNFGRLSGLNVLSQNESQRLHAFLQSAPPKAQESADYWYAKGVVDESLTFSCSSQQVNT